MKKKGFTLIELLAVIIILAVIALITVPIVLNIIEKSRKQAFLNSAYGIMETAQTYYATALIFEETPKQLFTFPNDKVLSFTGTRPKSGYVEINDEGRIELQLYNGKWCAYKSYYAPKIHLEEGACSDFKGSIVVEEEETTYFKGEMIDILKGVTAYDNENHTVENNIGYEGTVDRKTPGDYHITYYLKNDRNVKAEKVFHILDERYHADFEYTGNVQKFEALYDGLYEIELWGAAGGRNEDAPYGYGAYTKGTIHLKKGDTFYIYVGEKGKNKREVSFNGGGYGGYGSPYGYSGGGASDIRLIDGEWDNLESLKSRVMVAGGGGGVANVTYNTAGGQSYAGALTGYSGGYYQGHPYNNQDGKGGTQTSGGAKGNNVHNGTGIAYSGSFGIGGNNDSVSYGLGAGGGGGGYYGGGAGGATQNGGAGQGGGGGSSFISGYQGVNAIYKDGSPSGQPNHYSGIVFRDALMLSGKEEMPNPRKEGTMNGNAEDGYVRITLLHDIEDQAMIYLLGEEQVIQRTDTFEEPGYEILLGNSPSGIKYHVEVKDDAKDTLWNMRIITYQLYNDKNQLIETKIRKILHVSDMNYDYTGNYETFTVPASGTYQMELWGATGGFYEGTEQFSKGGYTKGNITLKKGQKLYIYIGEKGKVGSRTPTFNGGGTGGLGTSYGTSGGGATDIRLVSGDWDNIDSLKSRIMVAGGGGGSSLGVYTTAGGGSYAGGLQGYSGGYYSGHAYNNQDGKGGTQIAGGTNGNNIYGGTGTPYPGSFGKGGNNDSVSDGTGAGGGGGGYYGGGAGGATKSGGSGQGGGGGSSFISGYNGCNAINESLKPTGSSIHYSNMSFKNALMLSGREEMPNPRGTGNINGNNDHGYARIRFVSF